MTEIYQAHLENRTLISIGGADSPDFLQGLITNDIKKVTQDTLLYSCFLTPQGKFLFDFFITEKEGAYWLDVEAGRHTEFMMRLMMYKLRADVVITDLSDQYEIYGAWGADMAGVTNGYVDPRLPEMGRRCIVEKGEILSIEGAQCVSFDTYDYHRLVCGMPDGARDMIPERSAMLECNMDRLNALDWDKGCYMGQELTARTHYRGLVKRRLLTFTYDGAAPAFGAVLTTDQGRKIGEARSTCNGAGLALMKIEEAEAVIKTGGTLTCDQTSITLFHQG